jgi:hypothetical protein
MNAKSDTRREVPTMSHDPYSTYVLAMDKATKEFMRDSGSANDAEVAIVNGMTEKLIELDPAAEGVLDPA